MPDRVPHSLYLAEVLRADYLRQELSAAADALTATRRELSRVREQLEISERQVARLMHERDTALTRAEERLGEAA